MSPFVYRDFYDVPRLLVFETSGRIYLLDSSFDEETDDYTEFYDVYQVDGTERDCSLVLSCWETVEKVFIGRYPVCDVQFDPTKRKELDEGLLSNLSEKR